MNLLYRKEDNSMKKLIALLVVVFAVFVLVACAPANSDKAKAKMEKAGYTVTWSANKEVGEKGEVGYLTATKGSSLGGLIDGVLNGDMLVAALYDSASNAKKAFNEAKDAEGKVPENAEVVGKWVIYGSAEAVKAFKK